MTYEELVEKVSKNYNDADANSVNEHVAVQFNVYGEGEGAFYVELNGGKVYVQPYEYYDRDAIVSATADAVVDVTAGKSTFQEAVESGVFNVQGNLGKFLFLDEVVIKKAAETATASKKEATVDETKEEKKAVAKKSTEEKKAAPKKAVEKKTVEKKAEVKKAAPKKTAEKKSSTAKKTTTASKKATTAKKDVVIDLVVKKEETKVPVK